MLIDLGLRGNPPRPEQRLERVLDGAFTALERLRDRGLIEVGRSEYIDGGLQDASRPCDTLPSR